MAKFVKGQSGNPAGRPKRDQPMMSALRRELQGQQLIDWVKQIIELSKKDAGLAKYIMDKFDGKLPVTLPEDEDSDIVLIL